jgi:hypothetical protein
MRLVGLADHAEQGQRLVDAIHRPARVEDLVPAMFGIGLGEHHQLDIGRIAPELAEVLHQVIDLVVGQCQAQFGVGLHQRSLAAAENIDRVSGCGATWWNNARGHRRNQHRFGHAVVQQGRNSPCRQRRLIELCPAT